MVQEREALKAGRTTSSAKWHRHADALGRQDDMSAVLTVDAPPSECAALARASRSRSAQRHVHLKQQQSTKPLSACTAGPRVGFQRNFAGTGRPTSAPAWHQALAAGRAQADSRHGYTGGRPWGRSSTLRSKGLQADQEELANSFPPHNAPHAAFQVHLVVRLKNLFSEPARCIQMS